MILAINSSTLQFSLALLEEDASVITEYVMSGKKGHFGSLMPSLQFLLTSADAEIRSLGGVAVATGPGSFTGLRVGLAFAKGLCHGLGVPLVGVPSLEALANQIPLTTFPVLAVLNSRRGELFAAVYARADGHELRQITQESSLAFSEIPSLVKTDTVVIGTDFCNQMPILNKTLGLRAHFAPSHFWILRASSVGSLALRRLRAGDVDDPLLVTPLYLRPPDIRPNPHPIREHRTMG